MGSMAFRFSLRKGEPVTTFCPQTVSDLRVRRFAVDSSRASYANHTTSANHARPNNPMADARRGQRVIGRRSDSERWSDDPKENAHGGRPVLAWQLGSVLGRKAQHDEPGHSHPVDAEHDTGPRG